MTMNENANLIQFLQAIGWNDSQITNMFLCVEGRIPIDEAARKHRNLESNS